MPCTFAAEKKGTEAAVGKLGAREAIPKEVVDCRCPAGSNLGFWTAISTLV
jgi:hypothetical protein